MKAIKIDSKKGAAKHKNTEAVFWLRDYKLHPLHRLCNLCHEEFKPESRFERFCEECKTDNEIYHYAEWLSA